MAKVEQGRTDGTRNTRAGAKAPLSAHPAFAVIVALWFAALLGIGSLIVPIGLIEKLVVATGLPSLLSAAQPPLGLTARAGIALMATLGGAVIGLLVARQVKRANQIAIANRSTNPSDLIRRPPVNAHAELGSEGFDGNGTARRRALALAAQEAEELPDETELGDVPALEDDTPTAADEFANPAMRFAPPAADFAPEFEATDPIHEDDFEDDYAADSEYAVAEEEPAPAPFAQPVEAAEPAPEPEYEHAPEPQTFSAPLPLTDRAPGAIREDLAELGLVQLVQKLEATIEKHRAWVIEQNQRAAAAAAAAEASLPDPAPLDTSEAFGTVAPDEAAQAREAFFENAAPAVIDDGEQEQAARPSPIASLASFTAAHANEDEDEQEASALSASFALPFVRPRAAPAEQQHFQPEPEADEAEAALAFPGNRSQTDADGLSSDETDRALREALRNLQRMGRAS
ncbi:hypothetical protein D2V17_13140 [Aurantiacibacter xanthus]|uniref:Uncharacterized protein n=1 Tax=Aurantiacibacter xanthus TaxID=1784712 RepID=A0A3A1P6G3_9SPHN|nr:hypothetical protein [Aurantiacibacter xanthus]RIV83529.1 hypothetical protein D2V17_13140 [Aurantiacibacter xanthus]